MHANRESDLSAVQQIGIRGYPALILFVAHTCGPRTAHNVLPQKRMEDNLCWIICHVPLTTQSVKGLNKTELLTYITRATSLQSSNLIGVIMLHWNAWYSVVLALRARLFPTVWFVLLNFNWSVRFDSDLCFDMHCSIFVFSLMQLIKYFPKSAFYLVYRSIDTVYWTCHALCVRYVKYDN